MQQQQVMISGFCGEQCYATEIFYGGGGDGVVNAVKNLLLLSYCYFGSLLFVLSALKLLLFYYCC